MDFTFLNEQFEEIYQLPLPDSEMEEYRTKKQIRIILNNYYLLNQNKSY